MTFNKASQQRPLLAALYTKGGQLKTQLSPEAQAHLEVLYQATLIARSLSWDNSNGAKSELVADLMDAVHNIPSHLKSAVITEQEFVEMYYETFDKKHPMTVSLVKIYSG